MRKKLLILSVISLVILCIILLRENILLKSKIEVDVNNAKNVKQKDMLSMMLETEAGSGNYEMTSQSSWPTDGYVFNTALSKCENGGELSWDDTNKRVLMTGNVSDKCYAYFDKYSLVVITNYSIEVDGTSVKISVTAKAGTGSISKYFYSKDDGVTYQESSSSTYTFSDLALGTYKIKIYVEDSNGKNSDFVSKSVEVSALTLTSWIKNSYTGTQGLNGLYYHDNTLSNGAGDGSYRYAGSKVAINNYICLNTSSDCSVLELFRIIGVIDGKVKVIRDQSIGSMAWDSNGSNVWSTSTLNSYLNTTYYNSLDSTLKEKIADTTWIVGGNGVSNIATVPVSTAYQNELVTPATTLTFTTKIGLMYTSDYGFAASSTAWTSSMGSYDSSSIQPLNWMSIISDEWTITRESGVSNLAFSVYDDGTLAGVNVSGTYNVRPCFYLLASVTYKSGTGDKYDPIRIN